MKGIVMDRIIRVTGKGRISVKPDTIQLNINTEGTCKEYGEAVSESAQQTGIIRNTIEKAGLDPKGLKTVHFGVDTEYESYQDKRGSWKQKFVGYKYRHSTYIRFDNDNAVLGKVLFELSKCPVQTEFSIHHTVKDTETVKNALLGKAVKDSKEKAAVLTQAAGVQLGNIVTIDYSWGEMEIYSRPMNKLALAEPMMAMEAAGSYDIDIEAEDIPVEDTVTIVWEIC